MATAEFSKFAGILSAALSQHHLPRSGVAAKRSYPTSEVRDAVKRSNSTSKERWLRGRRRAERSYSTFKVRRGDLIQGKEQWLRFAGADVKRYPTSKVRETQVRR